MIQINLLPHSTRVARLRRRRTFLWCVVLGAEVVLAIAPVIAASIQSSRLGALVEREESLTTRMSQARAELNALTQQQKAVTDEIDRASAFRNKRAWSSLLELLATHLPADAWLEAVATDPALPAAAARPGAGAAAPTANGGSAPGATAAPSSITIDSPRKLVVKGLSQSYESLQNYAAALQGNGAFTRVTLGRSVKGATPQGDAYRFEILCEW